MKRKSEGTRKHKLKLISHLAVETLKNFDKFQSSRASQNIQNFPDFEDIEVR